MTSLICVNRRSRSGNYDIGGIRAALRKLGPVVECQPESAADIVRKRRGSEEPLSRIIVGGGDGTIHRALPTLVDAGLPVGLIPLGTANDLARSLNLSLDPDEAVEPILEGTTRRIGLSEVNGRLFVNAVSIGLGPTLTRKLDRERKQRLGFLAYLSSLAEVYSKVPRRRATVSVDDEVHGESFIQITIANGIHYGGGMTIAEDAALDDGRLRVLCLEQQTVMEMLGKLLPLRKGVTSDDAHDKMSLYEGTKVTVVVSRPVDVTADGEFVTKTPITCRVSPSSLDVYAS